MDRPKPSGSDDSAARAFARVGFPKFLAKLYRYATGTLRLAAIGAESADVVEAVDLVNALVEKGLDGRLDWALPEHATDDEVVGYGCTKLYGMRANLRRDAARFVCDDALDALADEAPDALARLQEQRGIAEVLRAFEHDAETSAHVREMLAGKTRTEIASALGCAPAHADVVRRRILRGMAALRTRMNEDSEDGPPSSGPRGIYHEPQATEERQGAAREPLRGAGGARGRR